MEQPEVDPSRISLIGHSEGTVIAPRVAIENPTKVMNIVLMSTFAQNLRDKLNYQIVYLPTEYAKVVLDRNHTGLISIQQIANAPVLLKFLPLAHSLLRANDTKALSTNLAKVFGTSGYISIDKQLKPMLVKTYENLTAFNPSKCNYVGICPILWRSLSNMIPNLSVIGNISKSTGILILHGENDSLTPVQEAILLQQRLTDVNHPDHTLITYPNLGHAFYPSSQWSTGFGPVQPYVLADLYSWLESHSGLSRSSVTTSTASTLGANTSSLNTNKTS